MDKEQIQVEVAQFFFDQLKESGRWIHFSKLERAVEKEILADKSDINKSEFWGYSRRAKDLLYDMGLIDVSGNSLTLKPEAFMMPDPTRIRDILNQKKKKKEFDDNKSQRNYNLNKIGIGIALLGLICDVVSKQGSAGQLFGWILLGFAIGYLFNDIVNKRL
jgi:hypothetical protein